MPDKAHKQTDKKLLKMEQHIRDIYTQAEGDMRVKWQEFMQNAEKRTTKLRERLENALKGGDPKEIQEARAALQQRLEYVTFRNEQYKKMVEQMAANYEHANEIALAYINGELPEVYALNYNYIGKSIESKVGNYTSGYSFTLVDQNTVKLLAMQDKSLLPTKKVNIPKDLRWNTKQINAQVMQGILQGESMYKIAARLQNVTDMTASAAIRNARTMVTGAENAGRMQAAGKAIDDGVIMKKSWIATHDERTRDWHMDLNGVEVENDEPFENDYGKIMYPGDPHAHPANVYNCRCTLTYKVVGFKKVSEQVPTTEETQNKQTTSSYVPSTTIEEAQQQAEKFISPKFGDKTFKGEADFKGISLENANEINKALSDIYDRFDFPKISGIKSIDPNSAVGKKVFTDSDAVMAYSPVYNGVFINKNVLKNAKALQEYSAKSQEAWDIVMKNIDKLSGAQKELALRYKQAGRSLVGNGTTYDYFVHEMGHHTQWEVFDAQTFNAIGANMENFAGNISGYATSSKSEYFAESFAAYMKGEFEKLDPEYLKFLKKLERK